MRAEVQNWRWAGVPFYLRTGKRMGRRISEIVVVFKEPPHAMFPHSEGAVLGNRLHIQLQPEEGMKLHMTAKEPGPGGIRLHPVSLDLSYATAFTERSPDAYERLLMDVIKGNPTLFMRRDEVEAAWTWVEPILRRWQSGGLHPEALPRRHVRPDRRGRAPRARRPHLAGDRMTQQTVHPVVAEVTARLVERSAASRAAYLSRVRAAAGTGPAARTDLGCANLAHGFAASAPAEKASLRGRTKPNLAIVTSYNDMLSAHQPFVDYPPVLKKAAVRAGGLAQVAGGVPAMCDGITQGRAGMQLSLYSRDVIAMSTAIALSHDMFDGAVLLGVCDKIVPGPADRRAVVRAPPDGVRPGRADALGPAQRREGARPPAPRRGQGHPRGAARGGGGVLPLGRHLHVLRHRQLQPAAHGGDGPAPARRLLREPRYAAARGPDPRGRGPGGRDHPPGR